MNKTYVFFGLAAMLSVSAFACSDDETTTTTGDTTTTTTGTGGAATTTTGTGGTSTTTGTGGTGGSGTGGSSAAAFCADYEATCDLGSTGRFADSGACTTYYEAASAACVACMEQHLGLAEAMPNDQTYLDTHCPHACGADLCAGDCGTSGCM